jgi:uncharacterized protein YdhG (YjbR/CyaY superfamily)
VLDRLLGVRAEIVGAVEEVSGRVPEEKIRYGMPAVMLGGRYALHYAAWKKHIGLYPVPVLDEPLESAVAVHRTEKDSVVFPHAEPLPYELIRSIAEAVTRERLAANG